MNRYRLNQILEILLFPATDPQFGENDVLLRYYQAYRKVMKTNGFRGKNITEKEDARAKYADSKRKLIDYLTEHCHGRMKSKDDILMLCSLHHPMNDIWAEMESVCQERRAKGYVGIDEESISIYYLKKLSDVADSLITYRDGSAAIKQWVDHGDSKERDIFQSGSVFNKVEIWNLLCRITVPDLYIVMAAVDNNMGMEALYEQKSYIVLADKLLGKVLQKGLAENHMHFNVGMDYESIWIRYTDMRFLEEKNFESWKQKTYRRLEVSLFRLLAALYIEEENCGEGFDEWMNQESINFPECIKEMVYALFRGMIVQELSSECVKDIIRFYQKLVSAEAVREGDYLLTEVYEKYLEYKVSSEFVFLYQCYKYIVENETDTFFAKAFLQYIRYKNDFFSQQHEINDMQGLGYFREKYDKTKEVTKTVMQKSDIMLESFRFQSKIGCLKKLEIRVAPNVSENDVRGLNKKETHKILKVKLCDQIYEILYVYRRYLLECIIGVRETWELLKKEERVKVITKDIESVINSCEDINLLTVPSFGIIFHFLKAEQMEDDVDLYCWRNVGADGRDDLPIGMSRRYFAADVATVLEKIRSSVPGLDAYLVGIDAASEENAVEPWMFAEAYHMARTNLHTRPVVKNPNGRDEFNRIQNIGFTYHVGEDFRHIVSGFRHTDEVIESFGYKAGDRLGHALVLGIDVAQWAEDNEVVPIPRREHLENLLWMWGVNTCDDYNLPVRLELLENRIIDIAREIYDHSQTITVKMLYQAYRRKFDLDHAKIAVKLNQDSGCNDDCFKCINDFYRNWNEEKLLMTNYCPYYIRKLEEIDLISVTKKEIEVYQKLQRYLIDKVGQKGIYVEVNPTSNLTIGDFSQIIRHPLFKLSNLRNNDENHTMIIINSDDPAIFNTNVENEMAYIYYAAEELGYSKSEILDWIERIRQQGMDASFIRYEKNAAQLLGEIQRMMDYIRKINV